MSILILRLFADASEVDLPQSRLAFDHQQRKLYLCSEIHFRRLNQIMQLPFCSVRLHAAADRSHGKTHLSHAAFERIVHCPSRRLWDRHQWQPIP